MNPDNRGSRSFHPNVRSVNRHGKPCSRLKSHFEYESSYRTSIGYLELLAAEDPDRFVWPTRWKQFLGKDGKKKRQLLYCLNFLEALGLITPAYLFRNGAWRHGYIVADHDKISETSSDGKLCRLKTKDLSTFVPRKRGEKRRQCNSSAIALPEQAYAKRAVEPLSAFENSLSAFDKSPSAFTSAFQSAFERPSECISSESKALLHSDLQPDSGEVTRANPVNPVNPVKESPVKENPAEEREPNGQTSPLSFQSQTVDFDQTKIGGQGKTFTYQQYLWDVSTYELDRGRYTEIIRAATAGAVEIGRAKKYEHVTELAECCVEAIHSLSGDTWPLHPETGHARLMGRVLDFMQGRGLSAPKPWIACLNEYRNNIKEKTFMLPDRLVPELPGGFDAIVALRNSLLPPDPPYSYLRAGYITEDELQLLVNLAKQAYERYPQLYDLDTDHARAAYSEAVNAN